MKIKDYEYKRIVEDFAHYISEHSPLIVTNIMIDEYFKNRGELDEENSNND